MKRLIAILCIIFLVGSNFVYSHAEEDEKLQLYARAAVLMDADSGRILFSKNEQDIMPMASTTKIMTCIIALEYGKFDDEIVFTKNASKQPKVHLGALEGEKFYLRDLLYSLMLESHNDTAVAIAEGISGSVHAFTEHMNAKADSIGCKHTHFVTPNGLDSSDLGGIHATTASDLAKIMKYCIYDSDKKDEFLRITSESSYVFSNLSGKKHYSCQNHNAFLHMMDGALSGKTGFTADAGYCYVGALEDTGRTFVVALLACGWPNHRGYKWSDTQKLMKYGKEKYHYEKIYIPKLKKMIVEDGISRYNMEKNAFTELKYEKDLSMLRFLKKKEEKIEYRIKLPKVIKAPTTMGETVGKIQYYIGSNCVAESPIIVEKTIEKWNFLWAFYRICEKYTMILK